MERRKCEIKKSYIPLRVKTENWGKKEVNIYNEVLVIYNKIYKILKEGIKWVKLQEF